MVPKMAAGIAALLLAAGFPALGDSRFRVRPIARTDVPMGKAQCDIRLRVDDEVEVSLRRETVTIHTVAGRDARDDGTECSQALPDADPSGFAFEVQDGRGEVRLVEAPSRANGYRAIVHIRDPEAGEGRYHLRLTWQPAGEESRGRGETPPGFSWNNALHYQARGRGESVRGDLHTPLTDVEVNIDRGGKILVAFRMGKQPPLSFHGVVNAREGDRLRADVISDQTDAHLSGPMFLSVDEARNSVSSIALDATDGRDRLHLSWDRRR